MAPGKSKKPRAGRVYLAGPEVFFPEPMKAAAEKKRILKKYGLEGHFPMDNQVEINGKKLEDVALEIGRVNEALIRECDIVIANMEPWHGPSMDVGAAYEMGFGRALGKIVIGYSADGRSFAGRVKEFLSQQKRFHTEWTQGFRTEGDKQYGPDGNLIETFGAMADNLMMINAVVEAGAPPALPPTFEEAARLAAELWARV